MKKSLTAVISFTVGLIAGGATGMYISKNKFEKIANEEIASAKEAFQKRIDELVGLKDMGSNNNEEGVIYNTPQEYLKSHPEIDKPSYEQEPEEISYDESEDDKSNERASILKKEAYDANKKYNKALNNLGNSSEPYVIQPEQYGEEDSYDMISLTLSSDGDLIDDRNKEIVSDIRGTVGDCLTHIGDYVDNIVHVRNEMRMCDYEICRDLRSTDEIVD